MMIGGMLGAAIGARWLSRLSETSLQTAVRALLSSVGVLLIVESVTSWESGGLPFNQTALVLLAACGGVGIGAVSTLLGVAGGELIIPTLVLAFAVPIKAAGTMSLLISAPTMVVGLARHQARGAFQGIRDVKRIIVPMALGTVVGSAVGGTLVAYVPAAAVKLLLGVVLIGSALRVFKGPESTILTTDASGAAARPSARSAPGRSP